MDKPQRAHSLILSGGADTATELAWMLRNMADQIERNELTVGVSGGYSSGAIYSYKHDPTMTHDAYFQKLSAELEARFVSTEG